MKTWTLFFLFLTSSATAAEFTPEQIELGRKLFFDPRLSRDGTISCATCHNPETGYSDSRMVAEGIDGRTGTRHTPTIIGAFDDPLQFWDGRTEGIQLQALQPLVNPDEMGNDSTDQVVRRLSNIRGYRALFAKAYGGGVNQRRLSHAIAAFESTVTADDAPADLRLAGYTRALSEQAERGFQIFVDKKCMDCHSGKDYSDAVFHNTGVIFFTEGINADDQGRIDILPPGTEDSPETTRAIKTPTLREIWQSGPYMHNGTLLSLEDVVDGYNVAWRRPESDARGRRLYRKDSLQDERIQPLNLSKAQKEDLVVFLKEGFKSPKYPRLTMPGLPR